MNCKQSYKKNIEQRKRYIIPGYYTGTLYQDFTCILNLHPFKMLNSTTRGKVLSSIIIVVF